MKSFRRVIIFILISALIIVLPSGITMADANIIYQSSVKETVTSGAVLEKITRFTTEGWLNISVLRVDLSNPNIKVDTLSDTRSLKNLASTRALAQAKGSVAAINGSFFNWIKGTGSAYPDGPIVESGKLVSADNEYNRYNDSMGTMSINSLNQVLYNYWKTDIRIIAPNGESSVVMQYNKPSKQDYNDLTIFDTAWSTTSAGAVYPDMVEMIVGNGKVLEIREGQPEVAIPENGYAVVTRKSASQFLTGNFKPGDSVSLDITTNPDWSSMKMAVTGSAILIKDGIIPDEFSFNIAGRHPRTAIGSTKNGKQLLLVTVDGRQNSSIGMTQTEMAQLMLELGAYNALNLDGGGSTTMVSRIPGTDELVVVNKPSDGLQRSISNAVGVFSIAPPSSLEGLIIDTDDTNVFVNTSREFSIRGYDRYFNPITVPQENIEWSVSGVQGHFKGNVFYPESVGEGKIEASTGSITAELPISVLSAPVQLELGEKLIKLHVNESKALTVIGKNKNGYRASISPADVYFRVSGGLGKVDNGIFTALSQGSGYIEACVGGTLAYSTVLAASDSIVLRDDFEQNNAAFTSYPAAVKGSYELSEDQKHSGKYSGKLTYDFSNTEGTRAAYIQFSDKGLQLDPAANKIGLWAYNPSVNSNWLRAEIYDSSGKKNVVDFAKNMDWTGWKYVEASLEGVSSPSYLSRIYLVQVAPVSVCGTIYIDDLSISASSYPPADNAGTPADTAPVDEANVGVEYKAGADSFRFSVFGEARPCGNLLERVLLARLSESINDSYEACAFVGQASHEIIKNIKKPCISTNTGYKSYDIKNSRLIQLDMSSGGLRTASSGQWSWFLQQLDSFTGSNVFIFISGSPQSFNDKLEGSLFQEVLTKYRQNTGKNIWVLFKGDNNSSYMEKGIKYISSSGFDVTGLTPDNTDAAKYISVTVMGDKVTFEFKPIV